ncbi:hypothetical protein [Pseudomonas phage vB_PaeM_FBPa50]|jgi:hypothetical protein|uniref:Uncharacterized protein n=4 Tax=Pbunavirus TaxID=1198980 RepID=A0A6G9LNK6_9CAUD|nr:hypothetical protein phiKT28_064 [Pseudomonas phage phiKT28]QIQ66561.1 hypothetical protein debbie_62 [Pseudomonas phage debbie]QSM01350.1 hypothetical protein vBPaeMV523_gp64 [Pseudomonas phage vB_PaeM_V523]USL88810.1 hypothetical protein [Pseudomonas phage vB_PaeM_FBPa50]UVN12956.1 hypothetical protein FBPa2_0017 [Pseudomonas phage vB_PaeM_FBPa2]WES82496.1 hypothetical protein SG1_91 [Pseudomonas phage SG1]WFG37453.1 hypothetical protein 20Oct199_00063 [Pseudomonas phage 20Oct199]
MYSPDHPEEVPMSFLEMQIDPPQTRQTAPSFVLVGILYLIGDGRLDDKPFTSFNLSFGSREEAERARDKIREHYLDRRDIRAEIIRCY